MGRQLSYYFLSRWLHGVWILATNAWHANRCSTLRCPAFTIESFIVTYYWLWHCLHGTTTLLHNSACFLWSCFVGITLLCQMSRSPSLVVFVMGTHVRNHPFLPRSGRHAYFLIERWLLKSFLFPSSDEDDREMYFCSLM